MKDQTETWRFVIFVKKPGSSLSSRNEGSLGLQVNDHKVDFDMSTESGSLHRASRAIDAQMLTNVHQNQVNEIWPEKRCI